MRFGRSSLARGYTGAIAMLCWRAMQLTGKVALVTGAGRGIGREIALHLAELGAAVVLNDLQQEAGARGAADAIAAAGGTAEVWRCDIRDTAAVGGMTAAIAAQLGRLDILVNNAAIDPRCSFFDVSAEFWDDVLGTNLKGAFFCAQAAAREMRKHGQGRIISISSVHGRASMPNLAAYAASKGGIDALTRQLALDLAPSGITVNAVAPGCVFVEKNTFDPAARGREIPAGRVGTPRDISTVVAFLASDAASWLTGQVITVDGGTTSRLSMNAPAMRD